MKLTFTTKLEPKDLFAFNMGRTYTSFNGWLSILLAAVFFWLAFQQDLMYMLLYIGGGLIVLLYNPFSLWTRSKAVCAKDPVLSGELHYEVTEEGIHVAQGEAFSLLPWDQVYLVTADGKTVRIYSSRVNAYIIPARCLEGKYDELCAIAGQCLPKHRLKIRRS